MYLCMNIINSELHFLSISLRRCTLHMSELQVNLDKQKNIG